MKYKCTGYQLVEQEDGTEVRQPCQTKAEEGDLFVKTWVKNKECPNPTPRRVIDHALCKECVERINQHRVEVQGKKPIRFKPFLSIMGPARARRDRRGKGRVKPKSKNSKMPQQGKLSNMRLDVPCGYCPQSGDLSTMLCEPLVKLRARLVGALPTRDQMFQVGICRACAELRVVQELGQLVTMTSVMEELGYHKKQKQESKAS